MGGTPREEAELAKWIGPPLHEVLATLLETDDQQLAWQAVGHYRQRYEEVGIFENEVYRGVVEMLSAVQDGGYEALVVTSKPRVYAQQIVSYFGLNHFFGKVYGSELDGTNTKKDDLIRHVLDAEQIAPGEAIMIGDRHNDIDGAKANGTASIGVAWGYGSRNELTECGADWIVEQPGEVPAVLGRIG